MELDPNKLYFSIKEVADHFNLNASTLRYWEDVFTEIKPRKAGNGVRFYTHDDIKTISLIYHLVKEKGMTLDGAKKKLKDNKESTVSNHEIVQKLKEIRAELIAIRDEL